MFDAMYNAFICLFGNPFHFCFFLKLGETSVMVTAVSKTKPSPSQFMPLVVCSLFLDCDCVVYRTHSGFFLFCLVISIYNVKVFGR